MLGKSGDAAGELAADGLREVRLRQIQDILYDVVTKRVLDEGKSVGGDLLDQVGFLLARSVVDTTLQHTTAMAVGTDFDAVLADGIINELGVCGSEAVETLLDDVVTVEVLDELDNVIPQGNYDHLGLLAGGDELDHLLERASAVLVESNLHKLGGSIADKSGTLSVVGVFEQLLAQIVAEWISHKLDNMWARLGKDHVELNRVFLLELALKIAAAVLVLTQGIQIADVLLERNVAETGKLLTKLASVGAGTLGT